jgi:hypothetical protein
MRIWAILAALATTTVPAAVEAQSPAAPAAIPPALERCIRDNAAKVEATVPDLGHASEFLVSDVCAVPLNEERMRLAKIMFDKQAARMKSICAAAKASGHRSPEDDDGSDACSTGFDSDDMTALYANGFGNQGVQTPPATALASQLLLDLRLSKSNSRQSQ